MAEATQNNREGNADSGVNPGHVPGAVEMQQEGVRNYFMRQLAEERGDAPAAPVPDSTPMGEQPVETLDHTEQSEVGADPISAEQPDTELELTDSDDEAEQPEEGEGGGLEIDGEFVTADQIRQWKQEASDGGMRLEDYRRKTQVMSRVRQEHEALGTAFDDQSAALDAKSGVLLEAIEGQLRQFEQVDTTKLTQEQFQQFQQSFAATKQGADTLRKMFSEVDSKLKQAREEAFNRRAASTREMLKWHEPRWSGEFYSQVRNFAVAEGLMSEEAFAKETDFLRMAGLIAMMDRAGVDDLVTEKRNEIRPSKGTPRQQAAPRRRNAQGQFQSAEQRLSAEPGNPEARRDFFRAKLAAERAGNR